MADDVSSVDINFNPKVIFGASSSYMSISGNIRSVGNTLKSWRSEQRILEVEDLLEDKRIIILKAHKFK